MGVTRIADGGSGGDARIAGVKRIAVLRANGLGDLMFALPALDALRAAYPSAEITLLAAAWHRDFFAGRPGPIDTVVALPASRGVNGNERTEDDPGLDRFVDALARQPFDLALQMHGGGRYSNAFVRRLGARVTAGTRTPDAVALDRWIPYVYLQPEIARWLEVVALVGAPPVGIEPRVQLIERDRAEAQALGVPGDRPLVALHVGAGDPRRRWPPERFAAAGDALARDGARIVVTGGRHEKEIAVEVVGGMDEPAVDVAGVSTLAGLTGLLARCSLVISNDSGPLHLGLAVGAPVVGLYWCTNGLTAAPLARRRHRPLVSWRTECPECGADVVHGSCAHHSSLIADISVEDVLDAARELLHQG